MEHLSHRINAVKRLRPFIRIFTHLHATLMSEVRSKMGRETKSLASEETPPFIRMAKKGYKPGALVQALPLVTIQRLRGIFSMWLNVGFSFNGVNQITSSGLR